MSIAFLSLNYILVSGAEARSSPIKVPFMHCCSSRPGVRFPFSYTGQMGVPRPGYGQSLTRSQPETDPGMRRTFVMASNRVGRVIFNPGDLDIVDGRALFSSETGNVSRLVDPKTWTRAKEKEESACSSKIMKQQKEMALRLEAMQFAASSQP